MSYHEGTDSGLWVWAFGIATLAATLLGIVRW